MNQTLLRYSLRGIILSLLIITAPLLMGNEIPPYTWGVQMKSLVSRNESSGITLRRFTPGERPQYKNKIMRYILSVDPTVESKMVVMRHRGAIVRDYLFVNQRLYTVLDDMGNMHPPAVDVLLQRLKGRFGPPSVETNGQITIRSYQQGDTKVLFYTKHLRNGSRKCKVYYYATSMFRMLIMDN